MTTNDFYNRVLLNMERLRVLRDLALLDTQFEVIYDKLTVLASEIVDAPVSLVSMVAHDHQYFKSFVGLPEPWKSRRKTPLSHSFCQHVVVNDKPLIVTDAREHDLVKDNLAIPDLNVIGYLGIPLTLSNKTSLGSFCVIDTEPREWSPVEINIMTELADILIVEFETRAKIKMKKNTYQDLDNVHQSINTLIETIDRKTTKEEILQQIKDLRAEHGLVAENTQP